MSSEFGEILHDAALLFVIPGLTRNPVFFRIPVSTGMTVFEMIDVSVHT
jgi:hypothetical protein